MNGQIQYGSASAPTTATTLDRDVEALAAVEELQLSARVIHVGLPVVASRGLLPPGESCHFLAPVRCGRRHSDKFGHLEMTSRRLRFHGAIDANVAWSDIAGIERAGRDVIVSLREQRRLYRFCCHTVSEAVQGAVVARHLASLSASAA